MLYLYFFLSHNGWNLLGWVLWWNSFGATGIFGEWRLKLRLLRILRCLWFNVCGDSQTNSKITDFSFLSGLGVDYWKAQGIFILWMNLVLSKTFQKQWNELPAQLILWLNPWMHVSFQIFLQKQRTKSMSQMLVNPSN